MKHKQYKKEMYAILKAYREGTITEDQALERFTELQHKILAATAEIVIED